jgi:hypothetical protein
MSTHLFSSIQAHVSSLNGGGVVRKVGKGLLSSACNKYTTSTFPQSACTVQLTLNISEVFDGNGSFSGTQTWQPWSGQQVVPPNSILKNCPPLGGNQHILLLGITFSFLVIVFSPSWVLFWCLL